MIRRSENSLNWPRIPTCEGTERFGNTTNMTPIMTTVNTSMTTKLVRQPTNPAIHVPIGMPNTEAMENPENTHDMYLGWFSRLVTSGPKVSATATSTPETEAVTTRASSSIG